ncbi:MAG: hypothetical protein GTN71_02935 [Anaerolineae bacterium]|nr:hypothetical protein [Anaerolineae bacterium]
MSDDSRVPLSTDEAMSRLDICDGHVHTFVQGIGADWKEFAVREAIEEFGAELAGPAAERMRHAVVIMRPGRPVFLATKEAGTEC